MAATKLDEALLIELGIADDRLNRELARAYAKAIRDNKKLEGELNRVTNGAVENMGAGFTRMGMDAQRSTRMATAGVVGLGSAMQRARPQIQNASFQIGDFATQLAGGTSASTALAQQLPQLIGGFGVWGAALGALAAVTIPLLAASMGGLFDANAKFSDSLAAVEDSIKRLNDISAQSSAEGMADLEARYGTLTTEVLNLIAAQNELARLDAMSAMRDALAGIDEQLGMFTSMADVFETTARFGQMYQATLDNISQLNTFGEQADALAELRNRLLVTVGSVEDMSSEQYAVYQNLLAAEDAARALARASGEVEQRIMGLSGAAQLVAGHINDAQTAMALLSSMQPAEGWLNGAISAAGALAGNLWDAVTAYNTFATSTPAAMGPAGSPVTPTDTTSDAGRPPARPRARPIDIDFGYTPSMASGGTSGGGSPSPQEPEYWDELIGKVREGEQAWEDYNQTVERGANAMADFFTSIADGSKSAEEAVADLLAQMAQVQMQRAFLTLASSGGTAGSIFGALGDALAVPSFAGGGTTGTGMRSGGVDGMGGFPAILHPNETVIDHTRGGAAGGASVVFNVDARGATADAAPAIEAALRRMTPQIVQQAVAASGKAMRSTKSFGNAR